MNSNKCKNDKLSPKPLSVQVLLLTEIRMREKGKGLIRIQRHVGNGFTQHAHDRKGLDHRRFTRITHFFRHV